MDEKNKTRPYARYKRLTLNPMTHRLKVKGWKRYFMQLIGGKSRSCSHCIRQNRPQNKESHKRQRRTLHNDKAVNSTRRYNHFKYLCTQHRSTYICETNTSEFKGGIECNAFILEDVNTPLPPKDRST